jgi:hypothetical protein
MEVQTQVKPIPGFQSLETHHCVTGSMRHVYVFNHHPLSEDLLLGIGGGVGFMYWHQKGQMPFIGGRGKGSPSQPFETCIGERTGVKVGDFTTTSSRKAKAALLEMLANNKPVMIYLDMGYLPYFDFGGQDYHFGGHAVVVCGYDEASQMVLLADRDKELHLVSIADLEKARGSTYKPFPPQNRWYSFDFRDKRQPTQADYKAAIREQVEGAINPPITNMGVQGIRKAAKRLRKWPEVLDQEFLKMTMFNAYIFIDAAGGTGGGIFRYMFGRFLNEAADALSLPTINQIAAEFQNIGDRWQEAATLFKENWQQPKPASALDEISRKMLEIAEMESAAWSSLGQNIMES